MVPADQRLDADDPAGAHLDLRLVVELELAAFERLAQVVLERKALRRRGPHRLAVEKAAVAAFALGVRHRHVGVLEQRVEVVAVARIEHDADRRRHEYFLRAEHDRLRQRGEQPVRRARRFLLGGDAVEHDDEFVAALAAHTALDDAGVRRPGHVIGAQAARQALRDDAQQVVSHGVSECVVDALEVVEVEEHDRERTPVAARRLERLLELLVEARAVGQLGEHVEVRKAVDLLDGARLLGRILDGSRDADAAAGVVDQAFAHQVHVAQVALPDQHAEVDAFGGSAARQLDHPAPEGAAILGMQQRVHRFGAGMERAGVEAEDAVDLVGAADGVALAVPLPASETGDALRQRESRHQVALRAGLVLGGVTRGLEPVHPAQCAPVRTFEAVSQPLETGMAVRRCSVALARRAELLQRRPQAVHRARPALPEHRQRHAGKHQRGERVGHAAEPAADQQGQRGGIGEQDGGNRLQGKIFGDLDPQPARRGA